MRAASLQAELHAGHMEIGHQRAVCVRVCVCSPLGRGVLTGAITSKADLQDGDFRKAAPRFQDEALAKGCVCVCVCVTVCVCVCVCARRRGPVQSSSLTQ